MFEFDLDAVAEVFGEPVPGRSAPERGNFWFEYRRSDGFEVHMMVGTFDGHVSVGTEFAGVGGGSVSVANCDRVRVLEAERKTLEIVSSEYSLRCFLALDGEATLMVEVPAEEVGT